MRRARINASRAEKTSRASRRGQIRKIRALIELAWRGAGEVVECLVGSLEAVGTYFFYGRYLLGMGIGIMIRMQ